MTIALTLAIIVRVLLAFIFLRAAWHKVRNRALFETQLSSYRLLPAALVPAVSRLLILAETLLAFTLPVWELSLPAVIAGGLLAVYTAALAVSLLRGFEDLDCGCGGESAQAITWALVLRNSFLIMLALIAMLPAASRGISLMELWTVVPACIAVILVYCSVELAIANEQRQNRYLARRRGARS